MTDRVTDGNASKFTSDAFYFNCLPLRRLKGFIRGPPLVSGLRQDDSSPIGKCRNDEQLGDDDD